MIILNGDTLTLATLKRIARDHEQVTIDQKNLDKVQHAREIVMKLAEGDEAVYGINTGFGHLSNVKIDKKSLSQLQANLLMSHACGVGDPLPNEVVRAMMALRINALIQGYSGLRVETIQKMVDYLNHDLIPVVYEKGSLGASGDLALLSHMSLPLIGLGELNYQGHVYQAKEALKLAGIKPLDDLKAKEGLSLINGTQAMSAIGGLVLYDAFKLLRFANLALALTMEALEGITDAYDERVHQIRRQEGQMSVAKDVRNYLEGSQAVSKQHQQRVQDAYSLRCAPQVHGASLDAFEHTKNILEREMNAVTDNPLIFNDKNEAISAGNFHGEPLAMVFDYMGIALSELANISERRIERMVNPHLSCGLPPFLAKESGLNSGFMIAQYTAASLVSENKVLSHPASVDSIPSSANQEDHVSMGSISARKAKTILDHVRKVIAIELMTACQAIDFRDEKQLGKTTSRAYHEIRKHIPFIEKDEILYPYMHQMEKMLMDESFEKILFKEEK
ncbi:MAG: histidine ammonia-lyase [Acholeplasmataceae bacterium]|jgi:histidine ammonia-lyase|nr:histidine ammonia-lyase [Acholeplasmataceae bacterium]